VATILSNPRYAGRQVWNRQRTDAQLADRANTTLGHKQVQRWNLPEGWVISARPAHPALVSEADFIAAQDISAARGPAPRADMAVPQRRRYLLAGLVAQACGRVTIWAAIKRPVTDARQAGSRVTVRDGGCRMAGAISAVRRFR
jgi:site-specific DNA recombinase